MNMHLELYENWSGKSENFVEANKWEPYGTGGIPYLPNLALTNPNNVCV